MVPLWCIGSRESFELAKMMIEYKIRTLKDLESVKDERDKLNSQLQGVSPVPRMGPSFRGFGGPRDGPPRGGGRRGGPRTPIPGQPFRGRGSRGGFRGGPPMRGRGRGPYPYGGRDSGSHKFIQLDLKSVANFACFCFSLQDHFNSESGELPRRGGRGGGYRSRGGFRGSSEGSRYNANDEDVGADGDRRSKQFNGSASHEENGPSNWKSTNAAAGSEPSNARRPNNESKQSGNSSSSQPGAKPQRARNTSGEAGKKRTRDDDAETLVNGSCCVIEMIGLSMS